MTSSWRNCRWGDIATLEYGKSLRGYEDSTGLYPVYGTNGLIGWHSEPLCEHPGVIIGRKGAYRGIHFSAKSFYVIDTAFYLKPKENIDLKWAYYALLTQNINKMDSGSAIPSTSRQDFYALPAKVPSLREQRAIATFLGTLDDKTELNRRMNETLESMARAIFKSWFVDFDPVRAKAEGRQPFGMDAGTAALFPDSFQDSTVGKIPKGWATHELGDVADVNWGDTNVTKRAYTKTGFRAFSASGPDGFLPYFDYDRTGVVVSAIGAEAGRTWLALGKWSCIKNTIRFWATASDISTEYLFQSIRGKDKWPLRGSAQSFISQGDARRIKILAPTNRLASIYGSLVEPFNMKASENEEQCSTLTAIRDALLPKLISGEIRPGKADMFAEIPK